MNATRSKVILVLSGEEIGKLPYSGPYEIVTSWTISNADQDEAKAPVNLLTCPVYNLSAILGHLDVDKLAKVELMVSARSRFYLNRKRLAVAPSTGESRLGSDLI